MITGGRVAVPDFLPDELLHMRFRNPGANRADATQEELGTPLARAEEIVGRALKSSDRRKSVNRGQFSAPVDALIADVQSGESVENCRMGVVSFPVSSAADTNDYAQQLVLKHEPMPRNYAHSIMERVNGDGSTRAERGIAIEKIITRIGRACSIVREPMAGEADPCALRRAEGRALASIR